MDKSNRRYAITSGRGYACVNTLGYAPELSLAMAYVPDQHFEELLSLEEAFSCGTLFRLLNKPFMGGKH